MEERIMQARLWLRDKQTQWFFRWLGRWALLILGVVLYTILIGRVADAKALRKYEDWKQEFATTYIAAKDAEARAARETDPYQIQLNEEATLLARVLYGVKDNDSDDLATYCWCVFNRADNEAYPDTLADVIGQPQQWMRYSPTNPVLEPLFQLAREQLDAWHTNPRRPVSSDFVYMSWSSNDICLRDRWAEGSGCHYWRYG